MTDLCGTCGAYWACDCPRGLRLDADGRDIAVLELENLGVPLPAELAAWRDAENRRIGREAAERDTMRGLALDAMLHGTFKLAPEGSGLS